MPSQQRQKRQPSQRPPTPAQLAARQRFAEMAAQQKAEREAAKAGTSRRAESASSRQSPRQSQTPATTTTTSARATLTSGSPRSAMSSDLAAELGLTETETEQNEGAGTFGDSELDDDDSPEPTAPSEDGEGGAVEASTLEAVFNSIAGTADDPHRKHREAKRTARAARRSRHKANKPSVKAASDGKPARSTPVQRAAEKKEAVVDTAAEQWYDVVGFLFILCMGFLVGDELAPNEDQAFDITSPLVRIAIRHYDPLQKASADAADATEAILALVIYLKAVWPAVQERQRAKQAERTRSRQQRHNGRYVEAVQRIPVAPEPIYQQQPEPEPNANVTRWRARHDTDSAGSGGGDVYEGQQAGADRYSPEAILDEYGI